MNIPMYLFDETTSTNVLAMQASARGEVHGACWIADAQSKGRGRREIGGDVRVWFSPAGCNLYLSVLLRPKLEPNDAAGLTLAAALGVVYAIKSLDSAVDVQIKWPNDLYIGGMKLAGILTEASFKAMALDAVVVGVGINVNVDAAIVPDELKHKLTSLFMETAATWDRMALALVIRQQIIEQTARVVDHGLGCILDELRALDFLKNKPIQWLDQGVWRPGIAGGIDAHGHLIVTNDKNDILAHVQAGEIRYGVQS